MTVFNRRQFTVGAAAMAALLSGCDTDSGPNETPGGDTQLRVMPVVTLNLSVDFWNGLFSKYTAKNPGVTIEVIEPVGAVKDHLPRLIAAGQEPDVVEVPASAQLAPLLLDLTDQPWLADARLVDEYKVDGQAFQVSAAVQPQSLVFYNKDAFDKAGITSSIESFEQMTEALHKLKGADYLPFQTTGEWATGAQVFMLANPSIFAANPQWYADAMAGRATPGDTYLPYWRIYKEWLTEGLIDKNALGVKYNDAGAAFLSGKSGMYAMGGWFAATEAASTHDFEVGVFAAPTLDGVQPSPQVGNSVGACVVMKSSKQPQAAIDLVRYLTTDPEAITARLKADGGFRDGLALDGPPLINDIEKILSSATAVVPSGDGYGPRSGPVGFSAEFNTQTQSLYTGRSPEQVAEAINAWWRTNAR